MQTCRTAPIENLPVQSQTEMLKLVCASRLPSSYTHMHISMCLFAYVSFFPCVCLYLCLSSKSCLGRNKDEEMRKSAFGLFLLPLKKIISQTDQYIFSLSSKTYVFEDKMTKFKMYQYTAIAKQERNDDSLSPCLQPMWA